MMPCDTCECMTGARAEMVGRVQGVDDPLEDYCKSEPDADECRVYED
jgi:CP12 domain